MQQFVHQGGNDRMILGDFIPNQQTNYLENKANEILLDNFIEHPYEIDLETIIDINYKNIKVFYSNQDSKVIIKRNMAVIIVNDRLEYRKQREELAEEFCHFLLHCGNQINYKYNIVLDKQEQQAKRMSAYLLCPLYMLKTITIPMDTYCTIHELADIFNVTYEFMKYRLSLIWGQDLNLITVHNGEFYGNISIE